jgi:protocatechuate 3,4-dioxygenase beta subunit
VTGTVTDEGGNPLEGIFVSLRALEEGTWSYFGEAETAAERHVRHGRAPTGHELPGLVRVAG